MEDDVLIRMVAVESLRDQGFQVSEASHAAGALTLQGSYAAYVHVLLTDTTMPAR